MRKQGQLNKYLIYDKKTNTFLTTQLIFRTRESIRAIDCFDSEEILFDYVNYYWPNYAKDYKLIGLHLANVKFFSIDKLSYTGFLITDNIPLIYYINKLNASFWRNHF